MSAGAVLRQRIEDDLKALPGDYSLTGVEQELLDKAVLAADTIEALQEALTASGPTVTYKNGQTVASPIIGEIRQQTVLLKSLITSLDLKDDEPADGKSKRGRSAANARWGNAHG